MSGEREIKFLIASAVSQAGLHSDAVSIIKEIIKIDPNLTSDERKLLSVAYKDLTDNRKFALRYLNNSRNRSTIQSTKEQETMLIEYKDKIIQELDDFCKDIIELINISLLPAAPDVQTKVFYESLSADFWRYSIEFKSGEQKRIGSLQAKETYERAIELASELWKVKPVCVTLALQYSVFLYEVMELKEEAIEFAYNYFKDAIGVLDEIGEDDYSETTSKLANLRQNLGCWGKPPNR